MPTACHRGTVADGGPESVGATEVAGSSEDGSGDVPTGPGLATVTGEVGPDTGGTVTGESGTSTGETGMGETTGTGGAGFCGDGITRDGEECDHGPGNSNFAYCTEACAFNVCGDGFVLVDVELCDDGDANSDVYGSACSSQCTPAPRCGDGLLQAADEECDLGPGNGTDDVDDVGLKCSEMCRLVAYRGFVTHATYTGDLGGLAGADDKCRAAAKDGGLAEPGKFRAFLSGDDVSANARFADRVGDPTPYLLPGGQMFAGSYDELVAVGPGDLGIHMTELGESLADAAVVTNTTRHGEVASALESCASWQSASKDLDARIGYNAFSQDDPDWPTWKQAGWWADADTRSCDKTYFHLYCLE